MLDVALDGFALREFGPLRQVADPDVGGIEGEAAAIRPLRAGQDAQQGGFAAAVRADQAEPLAGIDAETDIG